MAETGHSEFRKLIASQADPPDCVARNLSGDLIGFEVSELVDQKAIELNEAGSGVYRDWTVSDTLQEIQNIISKKDLKKYAGGPYKKIILVIPTDEPALSYKSLKQVLDGHLFNKTKHINEAYLLFSDKADTKNCPFIKLNLPFFSPAGQGPE